MSSESRRSRIDAAPNEETSWKVVEIVAEDGKRYNVRWAGKDPKTGKPWPLSWVPNSHCSSELIKEWERKKAKKESPLASSSSLGSPQAPVARSRPTNRDNLTKSSESVVPPTRKRKQPSPINKDDNPKTSKKRKPVSVIESQPGGDLGHGERPSVPPHPTNREDSPGDAPPHPPFEEIEMWVPTSTAKFGPPKRKHVPAKHKDPLKEERRVESIVPTGTSVWTQAPLTVSRIGLSGSQIIALREEEEESQSQPHHSASRHTPQLKNPSQKSVLGGPLMGDARGKAVENFQKAGDNYPTNQLSADSQSMDRNTNTSHVSGRNEAYQLRDDAKNPSTQGGNEDLEISPTIPSPTRKSLIEPGVTAVITPSTESPLPEKSDPRPIANSTPTSVEQVGPLKAGPLHSSRGTLAKRRAFAARARLALVRRAASHTAGNIEEGRSSSSTTPQSTTQPPSHVVLQQVLNGLESSQSQPAVIEDPKIRRVPPSEPREAQLSAQDKLDVDIGAANVSSGNNEPSASDEVPPTTQSSTQTQSPNVSSQASLGSQLAAALNLLHKKSEEISELQAQVDALRDQHTNGRGNPGNKRAGSEEPFSTKGADRVATGVQTDKEREAQAAFDLERARWAEEKTALQSGADALRADKAQALTDVDFFREQYQKASAFTSSTRAENEELLARATLAESQCVNGIAMIRATFEARVDKLEAEVQKYKTLSDILTERARRTDDDVRYRAAIAPELQHEYQRLQGKLEEKEDELDETKAELRAERKVTTKLRRLVARLDAEGLANGGISHDREPPLRSTDDKEDEDYVPGTSPSSSPPIENGSKSPPQDQQVSGLNNEEDVTMLTDQDVGRLAGDDNPSQTNESQTNDNLVYLCWWRIGERSCDAVVASKSELHEHVLSHHLTCH